MSKRKLTSLDEECDEKKQNCIIHNDESKAENFIYLKESSFQKICEIKKMRLSLPIGSKQRMEKECVQIPAHIGSDNGYHRDCYQRFTMNLKRIQLVDKKGKEVSYTDCSPRGSQRESTIFSPECIFCNKIERKLNSQVKFFKTFTAKALICARSRRNTVLVSLL